MNQWETIYKNGYKEIEVLKDNSDYCITNMMGEFGLETGTSLKMSAVDLRVWAKNRKDNKIKES
jgi:hypothetical protein